MASEDVVGKTTGESAVTTIVNLAEEAKLASEGVKAPGHAILTVCKSLVAGGVAGGVSRTAVAPLERLKILLQFPYVGLNFTVYESLKDWLLKSKPFGLLKTMSWGCPLSTRLACGAAAGTVGQTIAYPLDVICKRMQMVGWKDASSIVTGDGRVKAPLEYTGMVDAFRKTIRHEGFGALYKGLVPNSVKDTSIQAGDILTRVSQTHDVIMSLDKTISTLEMQLATARDAQEGNQETSPMATKAVPDQSKERQKVFIVMGIITAFSSRKRRDSIRDTWMPRGERLRKLEKEKGIVMRFVIGHSASPGGVLDHAIDAEEEQHQDFLRLNHVEGYHELSSKTQIYFSTAVARWDADFYIKVDDDVHVNPAMIASILARHKSKPRVYIGCMKSGPVLAQKGVKYHEPEYWKFGEEGNKYFRHATGQLYVISKDLATYISVNRHMLHRYANEDVSLGSWFIGLDVEHIDERNLCCGTPPDCEWKAQAGNPCAASFDWSCSGICKSVERMEEVHQRCGEGDEAVWSAVF